MNTRLFALVLSAPLAFAMGCGGDDDDQKQAIAACQQAGGVDCDRDGVPDNPDNPGGVGTVRSGLVVAQAPNDLKGQPFVGDFYVGSGKILNLTCQGASSCEVEAEGEVTIEFRCPKHLFLPRTVSGDPDAPTPVSWNAPGDWGLAPNGVYRENAGTDYTGEVTTKVVDGHIELVWDGNKLGMVRGNSFAGIDGVIEYSNGVISDDLKTITYRQMSADQAFDFSLTLVE